MVQQVTDTDGTVHEFPDDATPDEIMAALGSPPTPGESKVKDTPTGYGFGQELANGATLGAGPRIKATTAALKESGVAGLVDSLIAGLTPDMGRVPFVKPGETSAQADVRIAAANAPSTPFGKELSQGLDFYNAEREGYAAENPKAAAAADVVGSTPAALAGGAGVNQLLGVGSRSIPALARIAPFLTGEAGYSNAGRALSSQFGARLAGQVGAGVTQGATAGAVQSGLSDKPTGEQIGTGALVGGVFGPFAQGINAVGSVLRGEAVAPETAALAQRFMRNYGISLGGNQLLGGARPSVAQIEQFNQALAQTTGETLAHGEGFTQPVMARIRTRIGDTLDAQAARVADIRDPTLFSDLGRIEGEIQSSGLAPGQQQALQRVIDDVRATATLGPINGAEYLTRTTRASPLGRLANGSNGDVTQYANDLRTALTNALDRNAPPNVLAGLTQARTQWKNMKVVQELAEDAGPTGQVDPTKLLAKVTNDRAYPNFAFSGTPGSAMGDLAHGGQTFFKGAPYRPASARDYLIGGLGEGGIFWGANALLHDPKAVAAAALAGTPLALGVPAVRQYLRSPLRANLLMRSALNPQPAQLGGQSVLPLLTGAANQ